MFGTIFNGGDDLLIPRAPAEVAAYGIRHLLTGRPGRFADKGLRTHEKPRGTESALDPMMVQQSPLQGVKVFFTAQTFNGHDRSTIQLRRRHEAGIDAFSVHHNGTGATLPDTTTFFGTL